MNEEQLNQLIETIKEYNDLYSVCKIKSEYKAIESGFAFPNGTEMSHNKEEVQTLILEFRC